MLQQSQQQSPGGIEARNWPVCWSSLRVQGWTPEHALQSPSGLPVHTKPCDGVAQLASGPLGEEAIAWVLRGTLGALSYLHSQVKTIY